MTTKRIVQLIAGYSNGDAISNEARTLRMIFQRWGYESFIVCEHRRILPALQSDAISLEDYMTSARADDLVLLHLSIGSVANEAFQNLPGHKAILYHNITPAHFMHAVNHEIEEELKIGRKQMMALKNSATVVMADSSFNAKELTDAGYPHAHVFPLVLHWDSLTQDVDQATLNKWDDGLKNILFVGRCAPNKYIEDLLYAFHYYQSYVEPASRLIHVGSFAGTEKYHSSLRAIKKRMKLNQVEFTGALPQSQLNAAYQAADLFLCMSEHEGFCIPLLEAMTRGIPTLAFDAGAVSETMDGAGILFKEKRFDLIAEMMGRITRDDALKQQLITGQHARIERYKARDFERELGEFLSVFL